MHRRLKNGRSSAGLPEFTTWSCQTINSDKAEKKECNVVFSGVSVAAVATRSMLIELGSNELAYRFGMSRKQL